MATITFTGAYIRFVDLRFPEEGSPFARIHFTSKFTALVMKAMEWQEVPACLDSGKLDGLLTARNLVLKPDKEELWNNEIQLECSEVSDFQVFHVEGQEGKSKRTELRFVARTIETGAVAKIEEYARIVGKSAAQLKVTYTEQQKLPLDEQEPEKAKVAKA